MKSFNVLLAFLVLFGSCKQQEAKRQNEENQAETVKYISVGADFDMAKAKTTDDMAAVYSSLNVQDTVQTTFKAEVIEVCQAKGCWMKLALPDGQQAMVRFKDYGFFVPKDIAGQDVIVDGKAFVSSMSVGDQKHYAEDAGASEKELAKITEPKKTFGFEASGVLLKN